MAACQERLHTSAQAGVEETRILQRQHRGEHPKWVARQLVPIDGPERGRNHRNRRNGVAQVVIADRDHAERGEQIGDSGQLVGRADPDRAVPLGGNSGQRAQPRRARMPVGVIAVHLGAHLDQGGVRGYLAAVHGGQAGGEALPQLPRRQTFPAAQRRPPLRYSPAMAETLDDIDRILVRSLVADGRATLSELAASAGLSVSAVQSRVRRLESRGVVTGYSARIDPAAVGHLLSAFVAITPLDPAQPDDAPARLQHIEACASCLHARWKTCYSGSGQRQTCRPAARSFYRHFTMIDSLYRNSYDAESRY